MSPYKALIFDWDGTLFDSTAIIVSSLQSAFAHLQLPVPERGACRHVIGLSLPHAMQHLCPSLPEDAYPELVASYRQHYLGRDHEIVLFDGVVDGLRRYREQGWFLAVATGKSRAGLDRALQVSGLGPLFDVTRCADETFSKPHPEMLLQILDVLGLNAGEALMVGDTTHDMQLARNAGTAAVGVTYGAHERASLAAHEPLFLADSFMEFDQWLSAI